MRKEERTFKISWNPLIHRHSSSFVHLHNDNLNLNRIHSIENFTVIVFISKTSRLMPLQPFEVAPQKWIAYCCVLDKFNNLCSYLLINSYFNQICGLQSKMSEKQNHKKIKRFIAVQKLKAYSSTDDFWTSYMPETLRTATDCPNSIPEYLRIKKKSPNIICIRMCDSRVGIATETLRLNFFAS